MNAQRGIALAEWLLASVIGLMLLMAAVAWLSSSWNMALSQRQGMQTASAGHWLIQRVAQRAEMAGLGDVHPLALDDPRLTAWLSENNQGLGKPASDQLTLQFTVENELLDCEGTRVLPGNKLIERYFVRADSSAPGWVLACDAGLCASNTCSRLGDAGVALLADVDSFQVLYGLSPNANLAGAYIDATALRSMSPPPRVSSMRLGVLLKGSELLPRKRRWQAPTEWLGLSLDSVSDARTHRAISQTLELPNG